ncbi:hydroxypyruvate isomerase [Mesobacillus campisalis]|uniref:Hydroxypyruvate isomerase n=1 Tax=Mesobacillus campisalis TaxID=1408103 RepID=A0A0M2STH5_9BACI|nr:TIM barrel protein [Mesobacillus campisalis]KKK37428.1 hydroxypyruvate isomerase [Mesobacillus campisalis]
MKTYAVNLSTIFIEVPFLERFKKAREKGFSFVECQFPYAEKIEDIQNELFRNELSMVLLNLPPGNWDNGDRGMAADPDRVGEFKESVRLGIQYATSLNVANIHCMSGLRPEADQETARKVFAANLQYAAEEMGKHGLNLFIEPINTESIPGYFLNDIHQAAEILGQVNRPNAKLQFDFFHIEKIHGNALELFKNYEHLIGHVQVADSPDRHEPGTGTMDYSMILKHLSENYSGYIGLEYIPQTTSEESLKWLSK